MKKFFAAIIATLALLTATVFARCLFDTPYIGNSYRHTFHYRDCPSVDQMWEEHQVPLNSVEEARSKGFRPCGNCKPCPR